MSDNKNVNQDKGLQGNEKIEQAIAALQQNERKRPVYPFSRTAHRRQPTPDRHSENRRWKSLVGGIYQL